MKTCKDCKFFKNKEKHIIYSYPTHRGKFGVHNYVNKPGYLKVSDNEILNARTIGELRSDEVDDKYISWNHVKFYNEEDVTIVRMEIYGECDKVLMSEQFNEYSNQISVDCSDTHGLICQVGENFGCIHFKEMEVKNDA